MFGSHQLFLMQSVIKTRTGLALSKWTSSLFVLHGLSHPGITLHQLARKTEQMFNTKPL